MVTCEPLLLGSHVLDKYRACKQEFNFDKGSDEMFLDFLLDTSVKVIDIMKHLNPVLKTVTSSESSYPLPGGTNRSCGLPDTTPHCKTSKHMAECMRCRPTVHRPLFQSPSPNVTPHSRSPVKKFVQKLPNFVRPSVSKDHKLTKKNFAEFKCSPQIPVSEKRKLSHQTETSSNIHLETPAPLPRETPINLIEVELPSSSSTKNLDDINAEISQFEKEIGNVLESLTQSEQDISIKRLTEGNSTLSMIGMRQQEGDDTKPENRLIFSDDRGKHSSYTRLNSRYKKYPDEMLKQAMQSVQLGTKTVAQAAKEYNIPRQTLQYRLFKRKKKFHVFAPNIPYTNNFFIENYNNTQSENNDGVKPPKIKMESQDSMKFEDVVMEPQTDINGSSTFESDLRFNLEQTVKELLQCSENILAETVPETSEDTQEDVSVTEGSFQSESDSFQLGDTPVQILQSDSDADIIINDVISDIRTEIERSTTREKESETVVD